MSPLSLDLLHVTPYFYPAWAYGGIPRLVYGLARALVARGHRVTVLTTDVFDAERRLESGSELRELDGIRVLTCANLSNRLAYHHQAFLPRGIRGALRSLEGDPPDLIHLHAHWHLLNNAALSFANRQGLPCVMTPNGTLPAIERKRFIKGVFNVVFGKRVLKKVDAFVAVSRSELAQLRKAGIPARRMVRIPNGLDLSEFDPLPTRGTFRHRFGIDGRILLYLGKLTPRKGVDHLIRAFAAMKRDDLQLVIAGNDMGVESSLRALKSNLGLEQRVHFVGLLTGEERLAALADADVLAYPSEHEIFGLVPFEGLLAGAPAVVGDDCGCGELVREARAGLLVRYGDAEALARSIASLLEDTDMREAMVARGRRFIRSNLDWESIAEKTETLYRSLLMKS